MKTILYKIVIVVLFVVGITACEKDEPVVKKEETAINNPLPNPYGNTISGTVTLPAGSSIDLSSLTISSPVDAVNIDSGNYQMETLEDQFLTQLVGDANGNVYLLGYSYPGQTNFEINAKSTALAMLMNIPPSLLMTLEGKQELIDKIVNHPELLTLADEIDAVLVNNQSPLSIEQTSLAEKVATFYDSVFSISSKSYKKSADESYPIEILRAGNELTFINPGKSYETVIGIYKDEQLVQTVKIPRVSFVPTGIGDVIGAVASANLGEIPSGLQPVEETFTMVGDGEYKIIVRNGFYTNGLVSENIQAYLANLINWNTDLLLGILPIGNCVQPLIADLNEFIQSTATLVDGNPSSGEILGLFYNLLSEFLAQSALTSGCFQSAGSTVFLQSLQTLLSFTALVGTFGNVGNLFLGVAQWYYDDGAMEECYKVEGIDVKECEDEVQVTTFAGSTVGEEDGIGTNAKFGQPTGLGLDTFNNIYVAAGGLYLRKITPAAQVTTINVDLQEKYYKSRLASPYAVDVSNLNIINVTVGNNLKIVSGGASTLAQFEENIWDISVDFEGNTYVIVSSKILRVSDEGLVSVFAGGSDGFADGTGGSAKFFNPKGVDIDKDGNIYVADSYNHKIRKITSNGVVTTIAGSSQGFEDGDALNAKFNTPLGLAVDKVGNVYVADSNNHKIRKISKEGKVTTLAGSIAGSLNGNGQTAQFNYPVKIALDSDGDIFVADNRNYRIRKIILN